MTASPSDEVQRLRRTFDSGRTKPRRWRDRQLAGLERLLRVDGGRLSEAIDADMRRGAFESSLFDLSPTLGEVVHARRCLRRWMRPQRVRSTVWTGFGAAWVQYEPLGVALIVSPWNYPAQLALAPLVAALAAGNCAIVKPSERAPHTSAALAELLPRHVDPDAVCVLEGSGDVTQAVIAAGVDHVFFTGSADVGRRIAAAAAEHLTPVTLELGGKSPAVVTASADLDVAARRIAFGKVTNAGQTCVAPDHVLVDARVRDAFTARLLEALDVQSDGEPSPLIDSAQARRMTELLTGAGGRLVRGGDVDVDGLRMPVAVVADPDPGSRVRREEIFGPIVPVVSVDGLDAAVEVIRAGDKPLASYLFTSRRRDEKRFLERVSTGGVVMNHVLVHLAVPSLPFGGVGASGSGRYHGHWGFETFSNPKAVLRQGTRLDPGLLYAPYRGLKRRILDRAV